MVVGLTGGIGSGKTTAANLFAKLGVTLVDADVIAREVVAIGSEALQQIVDKFGADALLSDGSLNRSWLRTRVFADESAKQWLNALMHPLIRAEIQRQLNTAKSAYVLLVAPLLIENGLTALTSQVLVVNVSRATQIRRTCARDQVSISQVEAILAAQCSQSQRLAHADQVIDNDSDGIDLSEQVAELHAFYLHLASEKLAKTPT
ncbi:MAG: dephospho-CoA kinase [Rheinheimera sp.]|nr:dephospho-CoA kinase [Rheinheimera sp.]